MIYNNMNKELANKVKELYINKNLSGREVVKLLNISKGRFCRIKEEFNLKKNKETVYKNVQDKLSTQRTTINQAISKGVKLARSTGIPQEQARQTCLNKYGVDNAAKLEVIKNKAKQTSLNRYGVTHINKLECNREKISKLMIEKYATGIPQEKAYQTKIKNGTLFQHSSKQEEQAYQLLLTKFLQEDIERQYHDIRYSNPYNGRKFNCDFYIKSLDLFIECQFSKQYHYKEPFDINNPKHIERLKRLENRGDGLKRSQYTKMIKTWVESDPLKREVAKRNNLKFKEFFKLSELQDWLDSSN